MAVALLLGAIGRCVAADELGAAKPESADLPWEKASISVGGQLAAFESTLSLGGESLNVNVDAEELLDLDSSLTVLRFGALYRPGKTRRNQLDFTYAAYHRSGDATIDEEIQVGDITLPFGAGVETTFNFDIIRGTYSYALLQDDRMRVALGLGIYVVPLRYSLDAETAESRTEIEDTETTLPLPALALRTDFRLVRKLYLSASLDAMYLEISDFKGSILDVTVGLEYRPWKHVGLGLSYNGLSVEVEGESDDSDYPGVNFVGEVGVRYSGLMLYGKFLF